MITRLGQLGSALDKAIDHSNMVIHTEAYCGEQKSIDNPERCLANITSTFNALELAREEKKLFVYISTYDTKLNPYTSSKRIGEDLVKTWSKTYNMQYKIIRIPSIIGKGVVDYFITNNTIILKDRVLEFLTLEETVKEVVESINSFGKEYNVIGMQIHVQLLWELINYTKNKIMEK